MLQLITEINSQVALFRDLLIHIGTARDCPELREKIRKLRRTCVDACKHTSQLLLPQIRRLANSALIKHEKQLSLSYILKYQSGIAKEGRKLHAVYRNSIYGSRNYTHCGNPMNIIFKGVSPPCPAHLNPKLCN